MRTRTVSPQTRTAAWQGLHIIRRKLRLLWRRAQARLRRAADQAAQLVHRISDQPVEKGAASPTRPGKIAHSCQLVGSSGGDGLADVGSPEAPLSRSLGPGLAR